MVLGGCPKAPEPVDEALLPEPPLPGVEQPEPAAEPSTLAEAMASVTQPSSFELKITMEGEEITQLLLMEDGKPVKMVVDHHHEGAAVVYIDFAGKKMITYNPADKSTFEIPLDEDEAMDDMLIDAEMLEQEVSILGVEDVDGVSCWVVETTAKGEEDEAKVWIDREFGLIRQLEADDEVMTFSYSRINEVDPSEFEVPAS